MIWQEVFSASPIEEFIRTGIAQSFNGKTSSSLTANNVLHMEVLEVEKTEKTIKYQVVYQDCTANLEIAIGDVMIKNV